MHHVPVVGAADYLGPAAAALAFIAIMSMVKEPTRRHLNAILMGGAGGVYLSGGGFGPWETIYPAASIPIAYAALSSYRFVAIGWLLHAGWDIVHHRFGNPIWPFMPTSSFGCMIFDAILAIWMFAGAPSWLPSRSIGREAVGADLSS